MFSNINLHNSNKKSEWFKQAARICHISSLLLNSKYSLVPNYRSHKFSKHYWETKNNS